MIDLRGLTRKQLRALAATVETGSVTNAARSLHVTPPAITTQLKLLEASIGAPLFDRTSQHFTPTEIGAELLAAANDIERLLARAVERIEALRSGAAGLVVFGVVSTAKYLAPNIVAEFHAAHPNIRVKLVIGNRSEIVRGLERNEFDILLMGRPPPEIEVESAPMADHPHVLIAAASHRLAHAPRISSEDLMGERFLAREQGSGTRALMERFLDRLAGGRAFDLVEMGSNETIKQSVLAGLGVAIISAHTCLAELHDGRLVALSVLGLPLVRQWYLLNRVNRQPTRATEVFRDFVAQRRHSLFPHIGAPWPIQAAPSVGAGDKHRRG